MSESVDERDDPTYYDFKLLEKGAYTIRELTESIHEQTEDANVVEMMDKAAAEPFRETVVGLFTFSVQDRPRERYLLAALRFKRWNAARLRRVDIVEVCVTHAGSSKGHQYSKLFANFLNYYMFAFLTEKRLMVLVRENNGSYMWNYSRYPLIGDDTWIHLSNPVHSDQTLHNMKLLHDPDLLDIYHHVELLHRWYTELCMGNVARNTYDDSEEVEEAFAELDQLLHKAGAQANDAEVSLIIKAVKKLSNIIQVQPNAPP